MATGYPNIIQLADYGSFNPRPDLPLGIVKLSVSAIGQETMALQLADYGSVNPRPDLPLGIVKLSVSAIGQETMALACELAHLFGVSCEYLDGGAAICEPPKPKSQTSTK